MSGFPICRRTIFDSSQVADIGEQQVSLAGAGAIPVIAPFNTGAIVAGNYTVVAVLTGDNGTVARSQSDFKVVDASAAAPAHATVASDRTLYQPNERVVLTTRVFNDSSSVMLDSLGLTLQVFGAAGALQFEHAETVLQLPPGTHRDYSVTQPPRALAPGVYTVRQTLRDGAGVLFGQSTTSYTVASTADTGTGLSGSVLVMPKTVKIGESLALMLAVTNQGNSVLKDLPFKLDIADPVEQRIVAEFPFARSLDIGATFNTAVNWIAAGVEGRNYVAVLTALAGGKTVTLGQDDFKLLAATASPIKLDISQNLVNGNRVLVLVSCKDGEAETDAQGKPAACITERAQTIAAALTQAGASFTIATGESAFKRELRGGGYNGYWISGKQDKLHDALAGELREAAFNGDGLILDSEHDQRNKVIDAATGVRWSGKIGETGLPVNVAGAAFPQQSLNTVGRALKMAATTGKAEAVFAGGKPNSSGPAIISNTYGKGRAMTYGFDLPASLRAEPAWQTNLQASLAQVLPAVSFGPGAVVPVHTRVGNLAQATGVSVRSVLPAGAVYLNSVPAGSYEAGASTVNWSFPLAEAEAKDLQLTFRLAADGEAGTLSTVVSSVRDGVATPYGEPLNLVLGGTGGEHEPAGPRALALLNALVLNKNGERQLRTKLAGRIEGALLQMNANTPSACETAIGELIGVIDGLPGLGDVNTIPVRQALDRLLKEAQWRWSQLPQDPP